MNTNRVRVGSSSARWLLILLVPLLAICSCGRKEAQEDPRENPAAVKEKAETAETAPQLGASAYVNEDVSLFVSLRDVLPRWKRVWQSNAVQNLLNLPAVSQAVTQMLESPEYLRYRQILDEDPMAVEGLPVLQDAISQEIFVCAGPDLPGFLEAVGGMINAMQLMSLQQISLDYEPGGPDLTVFVDLVIENQSRLKTPSLLMGFKLDKPEAAAAFLDKRIPEIGDIPYATVEKRTIAEVEFQVIEWTGKSLPQTELDRMVDEFRGEGVSDQKCRQLVELLSGLRLTIAAGVLDNYLLLSVGDGTPLLSNWGQGPHLAGSDEFAPLRERLKPGLISTTYTSEQLQATFLPKRENFRQLFEGLSQMIPEELATGDGEVKAFRKRAQKDVLELLGDIHFPAPYSTLSFSFENKGIETFTYGPPSEQTSLDHSEPLSILAHRGKKPIGYSAARASQNAEAYDFVSKWGSRAFGYFEDFAVPQMTSGDREEYENVMAVVRPFVASLDETTREYLIPSAGDQSLVVIDGQGELEKLPEGAPLELPRPMPLPRIGVALELNDAAKFSEAISRYYKAVETLLAGIRKYEIAELPPQVKLFPPESLFVAGGVLYYYQIPIDLGPDAFPCALVAKKILILSTSSDLADEMVEAVPMPSCDVTSVEDAAGAVSVVDFAALLQFAKGVCDLGFELFMENAPPDGGPAPPMMIKMHLDGVLRSLGAFRSYRCTTRVEGGRVVQHSWLRVEDIPE